MTVLSVGVAGLYNCRDWLSFFFATELLHLRYWPQHTPLPSLEVKKLVTINSRLFKRPVVDGGGPCFWGE